MQEETPSSVAIEGCRTLIPNDFEMDCRASCGACCIAPSINSPFKGMPHGKPAGQRCVHLSDALQCALFGLPERPQACLAFEPSPDVCGDNVQQAMSLLVLLENESKPD